MPPDDASQAMAASANDLAFYLAFVLSINVRFHCCLSFSLPLVLLAYHSVSVNFRPLSVSLIVYLASLCPCFVLSIFSYSVHLFSFAYNSFYFSVYFLFCIPFSLSASRFQLSYFDPCLVFFLSVYDFFSMTVSHYF